MTLPPQARRIYVDSSVWIALLTREPSAQRLADWIEVQSGALLTALWTRTELASALSIKSRRGEFQPELTADLLQRYAQWTQAGVQMLPVDSQDFTDAAALCADAQTRLRAGDALHLVVARRSGATHLLTLDLDMQRNAPVLGLDWIDLDA
ncbi:MAG: type II toxin-antitoxin system VapC family toxin [Thiomonas sp.]